jgi:hypothetical protein
MTNFEKSPLTPLCQRGELAGEREEFPNTYRAKFYHPLFDYSPFEKGGQKGDLIFSQLQGERGGFVGRALSNIKQISA